MVLYNTHLHTQGMSPEDFTVTLTTVTYTHKLMGWGWLGGYFRKEKKKAKQTQFRNICWTGEFGAILTFSPIGSQSSNGMRMHVKDVDGINLKCALLWHIQVLVHSILCECNMHMTRAHAHTHTHVCTCTHVFVYACILLCVCAHEN